MTPLTRACTLTRPGGSNTPPCPTPCAACIAKVEACPRCLGTGSYSAPHIMGLTTGDIYTVSPCGAGCEMDKEDVTP